MIFFQKFEKFFCNRIAKAKVIKISITILLTLKNVDELLSNLGGGSYDPVAGKNDETFKKIKKI